MTKPEGGSRASHPPSAARREELGRWRRLGILFAVLFIVLTAARLALPNVVRNYVNHVLDQNQQYDGLIGDVTVHLWRGAYSIENIRLVKTAGLVPVPFFAARRVDLALEPRAML